MRRTKPNFLPEIGFVRRTDTRLREIAPHIGAAHEADLGEEIRLDDEPFHLNAESIGVVVEEAAVAQVVAVTPLGPCSREIRIEADVLVERHGDVDAGAVVRSRAAGRRGPVGEHAADAAPPQDVALGAQHGEVRRLHIRGGLFARLHVDRAEGDLADFPGRTAAQA